MGKQQQRKNSKANHSTHSTHINEAIKIADPIANLGSSFKPAAVSASNAVLPIILFIGGIGLIAFIIWFIIQELSYKHKFKIITITNGVEHVIMDKCKLVKDEKGIEVLKLKKKKLEAPYPPSDAIEMTDKGCYFIEARYSPDRGFEYVFPQNKKHQISTEAFTTDQKSFLIYQLQKSEKQRKNGIAQLIKESVPYIALVVIVVSLFAFWGDLTEPVIQMGEKNIQYQQNELKMLEIMERIESDIQGIAGVDNTEVPD